MQLLNLSTLEGWKAKLKNHLSVPLQLLHFCFRNILHLLSLIISCLWGCFIDMLSLKRLQFELLREGCLSPRSCLLGLFYCCYFSSSHLACWRKFSHQRHFQSDTCARQQYSSFLETEHPTWSSLKRRRNKTY